MGPTNPNKEINAVEIFKKIGKTISKEDLSVMKINTRSLRLKGKRKNAQKKLRNVFKNAY